MSFRFSIRKWVRPVLTALLILTAGIVSYAQDDDAALTSSEDLFYGIPSTPDQLLTRKGFSIGYGKKERQAIWVCYILSSENLDAPKVPRSNKFQPDPLVEKPVHPRDYRKTGFDKGHLAPAADFTYSEETMRNSFYMSNISPQVPGCNRGIWKRLEQQVRNWARKEGKICVITGPIFPQKETSMKDTGILIPCAFYKVILDTTPPEKMIGFIIPNEPSKKRLGSFVVTVDEVEKITGCDFFSGLPDEQERELESSVIPAEWGL